MHAKRLTKTCWRVLSLGFLLSFLLFSLCAQETPRTCPSPAGSNPIAAGDLVKCSVTTIGGHEWAFTATAGEVYSLALLETAGGSSRPVVTLYDASGNKVSSVSISLQGVLTLRPAVSGRHRIVMTEGTTQASFNPYSYTMSFERIGPPTASAPYMPLNLQFQSSIDPPGDRDVYQLNVVAGDRIRFRFGRTQGAGNHEAVIYDSLGSGRIMNSIYVIPSSGVYTLVLQDTYIYTSSGTVMMECEGVCPGPPTVTSLFPHYAGGAGWKSAIMLLNDSDLPAQFTLWTRGADGGSGKVTKSSIMPHGLVTTSTDNLATDPLEQGSAVLSAPPSVSGQLVFRSAEVPGERGQQAASVPLAPTGKNAWILPFDNRNSFVSGLAVATVSEMATTVTLEAVDGEGVALQTRSLTLNPNGHQAFVLADQLPATAGQRGLLQVRAPAGASIGVVGLRFSPQGAFTSLAPATLSTTASTPGTIGPSTDQYFFVPQIASGGGWSTEVFAFSRDRAASGPIKISSYQGTGTSIEGLAPQWSGNGAAWPIAYESLSTRSSVDATLGPNLLALRAPGLEGTTQVGWLSVARKSDFGGLAIFRQTVEGVGRVAQEASVPFFPSGVGRFSIPLDQRNGVVGLALANPSAAQSRSVTVLYRDYNGNIGGQSKFDMPPLAHFATTIDSIIPAAARQLGSIEVSSSNGDIAGIGLLFEGAAFTALPALR